MDHPTQQVVGIADDLVTALTPDVGYEADAAAVVLEIRMIETVCPGHSAGATVW
jgi:hypothetical protein